jgi:radical SAM superfamily enzyme YgiQ (UPF0313 family)
MKLLLVWPKARTDPDWGGDLGAIAEPLALEYLAAGAQLDGHSVHILDLRLHPDDLEENVASFAPDIVGVTAFSMHVSAAVEVCRRVKALKPDCWTIAGGHHATFLPEDFFEPEVDFVVSGEGVEPLRQLMRALQTHNLDLVPRISGLWCRSHGTFMLGEKQGRLDVDSLPRPDRVLTRADRLSYFIDWMTPVASIRSSVGCPYRCTFCSLWQLTDGRYHMRETTPFVTELSTIEEDFVFLIDDEAFINPRRMLRLAEALRNAGLRKSFFAYCRIDSLVRNRDVIRAWTEIGLDRLFVGIDAIRAQDLQEYKKGYDSARIEEALDVARGLGIKIFAQFIVNTNYSYRDFERLARFVRHHKIEYPAFTVLTPLPGTPLLRTFDHVTERQPNGRPNWDLFDTQNAVTATTLPRDKFHHAYRDLFTQFRSSYSLHRARNCLRNEETVPSRIGIAPSAAVQAENIN